MGRVAFELPVRASPNAFVLALHEFIQARPVEFPLDITREGLSLTVEAVPYSGAMVRVHMRPNTAGTLVALEVFAPDSEGFATLVQSALVRAASTC